MYRVKKIVKALIPQGSKRHQLLWPILSATNIWIRTSAFHLGWLKLGGQLLQLDADGCQRQLDEWSEYAHSFENIEYLEASKKVSLVTILYNRSKEIALFIESIVSQSFAGKIELVVVDDMSPDDSVEILQRCIARADDRRLELKLIRNSKNIGNCCSRNIGVSEATGEIIIIIDADCLMNTDFIRNHVLAHATADCSIVIGPHNLETKGLPPSEVLHAYEHDLVRANKACELQDSIAISSFLNCITRNFSIKNQHLPDMLFNPDFTYSRDPESGFGWEDVEMGYRLYKA
jgi:glycosyltransferase involved in cell wall biosynthesis